MTLGLDLQVSQEAAGAEPNNLHKVYKSTNTHTCRKPLELQYLTGSCRMTGAAYNNENNWITAQ